MSSALNPDLIKTIYQHGNNANNHHKNIKAGVSALQKAQTLACLCRTSANAVYNAVYCCFIYYFKEELR